MLLTLLCAVIAAPVFASDAQTGAQDIQLCTKNGGLRLAAAKLAAAFSITAEYKEILARFKKEFGAQFGIKELGIFGSVARGEHREDSDLDVFVSLEKVEPFIIFDLKELLESLCKCKVDLVRLRDSLRPALKNNILKDGIYV